MSRKSATKIFCADASCKNLDNYNICKLSKVTLSWHSVVTLNDGRQEFLKCKSYEESEASKQFKERLAELIDVRNIAKGDKNYEYE